MKYKNREEFLNKLYNNIYGRSSNAHIRKSDSPTEKIKVFRVSRKNTRYSKK